MLCPITLLGTNGRSIQQTTLDIYARWLYHRLSAWSFNPSTDYSTLVAWSMKQMVIMEHAQSDICSPAAGNLPAMPATDIFVTRDEDEQMLGSKKRKRSKAQSTTPKKKTKREIAQILKSRQHNMTALANDIRSRKYVKIVFLVGAGISVNAGIPDFRSPKSGLYAQVKRMGLPHPEDIFTLDCFLDDPRAFYNIAKMFFRYEAVPTKAHRFMKTMETHQSLLMVYTQNIDGLEVDVGLSEKKLVQAHGHMRTAHCCKCRKEFGIEEFFLAADNDRILYCDVCQDQSRGIVKPDIIFFGEKLPRTFHTRLQKIEEADLIFVMGTSMKVKPFSTLLSNVPIETPIVVINRDLPAPCGKLSNGQKKASKSNLTNESQHDANSFLERQTYFFDGDIEETVTEFMQYLQW